MEPFTNRQPKQRWKTYLQITTCVIFGSAAGVLLWSRLHPAPSVTDLQAKAMGLKDGNEYQATHVVSGAALRNHSLTDDQFRQLTDFFRSGSMGAQRFAVITVWDLRGKDQHEKALRILETVGANSNTIDGWAMLPSRWREPADQGLLTNCLNHDFAMRDQLRLKMQAYGLRWVHS